MKQKHYSFFLLFLFLCSSCVEQDPPKLSTKKNRYTRVLENTKFSCESNTSLTYHIYAKVNGEPYCKYDSSSQNFFLAARSRSKSTKKGSIEYLTPTLTLGNPTLDSISYFNIRFPRIEHIHEKSIYFDSLFSKPVHELLGQEYIKSEDPEEQLEYFNKIHDEFQRFQFVIEYSVSKLTSKNSAKVYTTSTVYGDQSDSYIKLNSIEKTYEFPSYYYILDIEFSCDLYYDPERNDNGIWATVRDGKILAKVEIKGE